MSVNPPPWWESPWAIGTGMVVSGVALGAGIGAAARALTRRADCSAVSHQSGVVAGVPYLERIRGNASHDQPLPMVILFHSLGATTAGHAAMLGGIGNARLILPEGEYFAAGDGRKWWQRGIRDAVEKGYMDEAVSEWSRAAQRMDGFIEAITQCRPTVGKPILTGSSQGGEMTLLMASVEPKNMIHGGVAVSAYLLPPFWNARMAPVVMIHGTGDTVVPFSWAKQYAQQMQQQGAPVTFEEFASSGHAVTKPMASAWIGSVKQMVAQIS